MRARNVGGSSSMKRMLVFAGHIAREVGTAKPQNIGILAPTSGLVPTVTPVRHATT
jgi:hypothetical protein